MPKQGVAQILSNIAKRVNSSVYMDLHGSRCIEIALAVSVLPISIDIISMMLPTTQAMLAIEKADTIAITDQEWCVLSAVQRTNSSNRKYILKEVAGDLHEMELVLQYSISEKEIENAWSKADNKIACYVAMHMHHLSQRIQSVLGTLMTSDIRSLEYVSDKFQKQHGHSRYVLSCCILHLASVCY
jgi:hypothetical protein